MEARAATVLKRLAERPEFSIIETRDHTVLRHIVAALIRNRVPLRAIAGLINPNVAYRGVAATERRLRQTLTLPANATASQRLDFVEQRLGSVFLLMPRTFAYAVGGLLMLAASRRLLGDVARAGRASRGAARPAPQRHYRNGSRALESSPSRSATTSRPVPPSRHWRCPICSSVIASEALPPVAQRGLQSFLRRYGHRAVAEIDLGMPRWSDDPSHLLGVISNYLRLDTADLDPVAQFHAGQAKAEATITSLTGRMAERSRLRARLVGWTLRRVRQLVGLRESTEVLAGRGTRNHARASQGRLAGSWLPPR